jgi:hypothetical protein
MIPIPRGRSHQRQHEAIHGDHPGNCHDPLQESNVTPRRKQKQLTGSPKLTRELPVEGQVLLQQACYGTSVVPPLAHGVQCSNTLRGNRNLFGILF